MRKIVLDTETTGLDYKQGHRILELACIEIKDRRFTKRSLHHYINPERQSDEGALRIHGLTQTFLKDKPKFSDIVDDFLTFIDQAELVIHNASFDIGFLNAELKRLGKAEIQHYCPVVIDTLQMARARHPGKRNNLDALCERYVVDNSKRTLHGALLDAQLLGEVFLAMTRGQDSLLFENGGIPHAQEVFLTQHSSPIVLKASEEEVMAHHAILESMNAL